ncbi:hypothetical protein ABPG74_000600 [Tetrahymena malaccensis]
MGQHILFIFLIALTTVLANTTSECALLTTSSTCSANSSCKFITSSTKCISKQCRDLSPQECRLPANSEYCDSVSGCVQAYQCSTLKTQLNCQSQPAACVWNNGICTNIATLDQCGQIGSSNCNSNPGCSLAVIYCINKPNISCSPTDNQVTCQSSGKYCTYQENGICDLLNTSHSILTISVIAIIALV